uniref:Cyclotide mobo-B n=1 Tax=Melicytus obovatus TaxID=450841 RepID=CYMBB_MELOB|nr:RecName: Full=Cyclotide mobo-B [Melicytus obovatus]
GKPICGETCAKGKCYTPKCTCNWPICYKN